MSFLGIDFGTTYSSMAWFDERSGRAEIIRNAEGDEKTPSVVYYGQSETVVGKGAMLRLEDMRALDDPAERRAESARIIRSVKRNLSDRHSFAIPGRDDVTPVDVVAAVLAKLKRDAEARHFHEAVSRVVLTCPAVFNAVQRRLLERAARQAGFSEVALLDEPAAAAMAYAEGGLRVGDGVLVYDLGGGTFDLACVRRTGGGEFRLAMETDGDGRCGGDDFDQALYGYWEDEVRTSLGRGIALDTDSVDPCFLFECRRRKENLSEVDSPSVFSSLIPGGRFVKLHIDRPTFEGLIRPIVERTARKAKAMLERATNEGCPIDTVVLIGGSSKVPLVKQCLRDVLPFEPREWHLQDVAVALGAACEGRRRFGSDSAPKTKSAGPVASSRDAAQASLGTLVARHGAVLAFDADRLAKLLAAAVPSARDETRGLVAAARHGIAERLSQEPDETITPTAFNETVRRLALVDAMQPGVAEWAVGTWLAVLGKAVAPTAGGQAEEHASRRAESGGPAHREGPARDRWRARAGKSRPSDRMAQPPPGGQASTPEAARANLVALVASHVGLAYDAERVSELLAVSMSGMPEEMAALIAAARLGIARQLYQVRSSTVAASVFWDVVRRLALSVALRPSVAEWAVGAWAEALGKSVELEDGGRAQEPAGAAPRREKPDGAAPRSEEPASPVRPKDTVPAAATPTRARASGAPAAKGGLRDARLSTYELFLYHFLTLGLFSAIRFPAMHAKLPNPGPRDPSAAKAAALMFVPFYNIYWAYRVFARLSERLSQQRELRGLSGRGLTREGDGAALCYVVPAVVQLALIVITLAEDPELILYLLRYPLTLALFLSTLLPNVPLITLMPVSGPLGGFLGAWIANVIGFICLPFFLAPFQRSINELAATEPVTSPPH